MGNKPRKFGSNDRRGDRGELLSDSGCSGGFLAKAKPAQEPDRTVVGIPLAAALTGTVAAFALSVWHGSTSSFVSRPIAPLTFCTQAGANCYRQMVTFLAYRRLPQTAGAGALICQIPLWR